MGWRPPLIRMLEKIVFIGKDATSQHKMSHHKKAPSHEKMRPHRKNAPSPKKLFSAGNAIPSLKRKSCRPPSGDYDSLYLSKSLSCLFQFERRVKQSEYQE